MALPLFAIALLMTPPPCEGISVPKEKLEYTQSELPFRQIPYKSDFVPDSSYPSYNKQVSEENPPLTLRDTLTFPTINSSSPTERTIPISPSELSFSFANSSSLQPPPSPQKSLPLLSFETPPLPPPTLGTDLPYPLNENQLEAVALAHSPETPPHELSISPPPCTLSSPDLSFNESFVLDPIPYTPRSSSLLRDTPLLSMPILEVSPLPRYDAAASLEGLFPPHKEQEFPFIPLKALYPPYHPSCALIKEASLLAHEPPLPSLFQYTHPVTAQAHIQPLLQNYSSREYNLSRQPTSDELNNVAFDDQFDITVGVIPRTDRKGYLFHINLFPKANLTLHHLKQNFVFVIDKSSSIKQFRYEIFRRAVLDSLDYLQEGDTFNIYVVDNKTHKLSEEPLLWRKSNVRKAQEFLFSQEFNKYYTSSADTYDVIESVQQDMNAFEGELTIILVTDGSTLMDIKKRKHTLSHLIYTNNKKYTLHTACMSKDSSGSMLDLLSTFNQGEFISSQTHAAFPRKFCRLVKHVSQMITKDIHLSTLSDHNVSLFPSASAMPQMYVDRPFTIYGTIDELDNFDLIVQGKFDDRYLFMKKKIPLKTAPRSTKPLQKQFAIHQAYLCYEHYLTGHDEFYLEEAKKQLAKYKLRAAVDKKK